MPSASWVNGWVTGDVVTAAEYRKSMGSIFDTTLGVAAATIDITGIVATYAHLMIEFYLRGDTAATATPLNLRLNGVSTASYQYQQLSSSAAVTTSAEGLATTVITLGSIPAATATANYFGAGEILIPHYASGSNAKSVEANLGYRTGNLTGNGFTHRTSGWGPTAAVNQVTLIPGAGNFLAGSRCTVYAMGS
jgi:hypothetical protein